MVRWYEPGKGNHEFDPRLGNFFFLRMEKEVKINNWTPLKLPYICWVFLQMSGSLLAFFHLCHFSVLFSAPSLTKTSFLSNHSFWKVIQNNGSHWRMCWHILGKLNGVITFSAVAPWDSKPPCKISGIREGYQGCPPSVNKLLFQTFAPQTGSGRGRGRGVLNDVTHHKCPPLGQRRHLDWDSGGV